MKSIHVFGLLVSSSSLLALSACNTTPSGSTSHEVVTDNNTKVYRFKIGRAGNASLNDGTAAGILRDATEIVAGKHRDDDFTANIRFEQSGPIDTVSSNGVVNSAEDFRALSRLGRNVVVVDAINYCGGYIPGVVGCAPVPGSFMAVVRYGSLEGMIWAHEFGHNCGLNHRDHSTALMHPQIGSAHKSLNQHERDKFEQKVASGRSRSVQSASESERDGAPPSSAQEYLDRVYLHGVPYAHVEGFGPQHIPALKAALNSPNRLHSWSNAVVGLAAIATPESVEAVLSFVRANNVSVSSGSYQVKRTAVMALGYAVQKASTSQDPVYREARAKALAQLQQAASGSYWRSRVGGTARSVSGADPTEGLVTSALAGLALSGAPEAAAFFENASRGTGRSVGDDPIAEARKEYAKVKAQGVRSYTD
ncbi:matrixin [Roseimicrobium gellanilyticum]|uniref:Matrixin n=1 Tax=Roseimicrobium gellanilyticum TaxID=748857 RepID=A0A366HV05_9BACT|nr:matrixin family metalloprotease [Roseimicrobium gellanilyticum]RBP46537.1 matrixin [Roseimicrobium gellanilyticum]